MPIVEMPDGTEIEFPDNMSPSDISAAIQKMSAPSAPQAAPQAGGGQSMLSGMLDRFSQGAAFGFGDEITAGEAALLGRTPEGGWFDYSKPMGERYSTALEAERAQNKAFGEAHPVASMVPEIAGAIASGVVTGGATTGLRGAGVAAGQGALYGFGSGEGGAASRLESAGTGAAGGLAGYGVGRGISRMLSPQTSKAATQLMDEGVPLTPGQIAGGLTKKIEDRATSLPIIGDAIKAGQRRSLAGFNRAAVNRVLKNIGKRLPDKIDEGYDAVGYAQKAVSEAYDDILPKLTVKADKEFADGLSGLHALAKEMPTERYDQFRNIIDRQILGRFSKNGSMTGEAMKEAESEMGRLIRQYGKSLAGDERLLADALREAQSVLRQAVVRSNPTEGIRLRSINSAFANLTRVERAASQASGGAFTPGQLQTATRVMDSSVRKKASAGGNALMQDLAAAGREVLPSSVADSGTAERLTQNLLIGGGVGYLSPEALAAGLALSSAYTRPGQALITPLLASRPEALRRVGGLLGAVPLGGVGGVLASQ